MENLIDSCNNSLILSGKIALLSTIIPIVFALLKWKLLTRGLKIFLRYIILYVLLNSLDFIYVYLVDNYTSFFESWLIITGYSLFFLLILYQLNNFLTLGHFFSYLLKERAYGKKIWGLSVFLSLLAILAYILEKGWKNYGTIGPSAEAIYLFIVPLFYLWYLSRATHSIPSLKNPYFLISLGLALPNLIGSFLYFTGDFIQAENFCLFARLSITKNCFYILAQFLFVLAFWRAHFTKYIPPTAI